MSNAWAVIHQRRHVLNERMAALDELGIPDVLWYADTVDQMQTLADLALALYADHVGATQTPEYMVRRQVQASLDAVLMHLDAPAPTDFRRVRELLLAACPRQS